MSENKPEQPFVINKSTQTNTQQIFDKDQTAMMISLNSIEIDTLKRKLNTLQKCMQSQTTPNVTTTKHTRTALDSSQCIDITPLKHFTLNECKKKERKKPSIGVLCFIVEKIIKKVDNIENIMAAKQNNICSGCKTTQKPKQCHHYDQNGMYLIHCKHRIDQKEGYKKIKLTIYPKSMHSSLE